ncbi:MAG TPA: aspartate carbamoyltransferase [Nitrososphaerales archaeon]|nr:aspartate carbamoyltransferase [Nitrososphaerales archaeon]
MDSAFKGKDVLSTSNVSRQALEEVLDEAANLKSQFEEGKTLHKLDGRILCTAFFEPSTRTRLSFQFAMTKMGGAVVDFGSVESSSIAKGETFADTMKMVDGYSPDIIVVRSKTVGAAAEAADVCITPVINAGDGSNEHPTQAMLDLFTIREARGSIDGVRIGLMGDLSHSRTTSSLSFALDKFRGVHITYIAPEQLQAREEVVSSLKNARCESAGSLDEVQGDLDFLYVTRLQKERFTDATDYDRLKGSYQISASTLGRLGKIPFVMHPLPRVDELSPDVDVLPQAKYFEQARNGVFVRAALMKLLIGA